MGIKMTKILRIGEQWVLVKNSKIIKCSFVSNVNFDHFENYIKVSDSMDEKSFDNLINLRLMNYTLYESVIKKIIKENGT
jgi:hypothetical protein